MQSLFADVQSFAVAAGFYRLCSNAMVGSVLRCLCVVRWGWGQSKKQWLSAALLGGQGPQPPKFRRSLGMTRLINPGTEVATAQSLQEDNGWH